VTEKVTHARGPDRKWNSRSWKNNFFFSEDGIFFSNSTFFHADQGETKSFFHTEITFLHAGIPFFHAWFLFFMLEAAAWKKVIPAWKKVAQAWKKVLFFTRELLFFTLQLPARKKVIPAWKKVISAWKKDFFHAGQHEKKSIWQRKTISSTKKKYKFFQFLLVIILPNKETFGYLVLASVGTTCVGSGFYTSYMRPEIRAAPDRPSCWFGIFCGITRGRQRSRQSSVANASKAKTDQRLVAAFLISKYKIQSKY
jgi:hypothetical protein